MNSVQKVAYFEEFFSLKNGNIRLQDFYPFFCKYIEVSEACLQRTNPTDVQSIQKQKSLFQTRKSNEISEIN